ncbi:MAG: STAS domain-containing protein [Bacteroidales bacterium]
MEIIETKKGEYLVLTLAGFLNQAALKELETRIDDLIVQGENRLVVDCTGLVYISSSGLRILLFALRKARAAGGTLRLCGVHDNIREVMIIAGFTSIFNIFDSLEEAVS